MAAAVALPTGKQDHEFARINLSLTASQKRRIFEEADAAGVGVCEWIRRRIFSPDGPAD